MKFFDIDSPLYKFMSTLAQIIVLNFCWLICSLPIVTMGAATTAAFSVTLKMVDDAEGYVARQFFRAFKQNLKQGSMMGVLALLATYSLWFNFANLSVLSENAAVAMLCVGVIGTALVCLSLLYAFALLARYENSIMNTLRNSFKIAIRYFAHTLMLLAVVAIEVIIFCFNTTTIFFGILIGPMCIIYTISGVGLNLFRRIETRQDEEE